MDEGQKKAAAAAEAWRGELGLPQTAIGITPKTWKKFVSGEVWPERAKTRSSIEGSLGLNRGALNRIASGESTLEQEIADDASAAGPSVSDEVAEMLVLLKEIDANLRDGHDGLARAKLNLMRDLIDRLLEADSSATGS